MEAKDGSRKVLTSRTWADIPVLPFTIWPWDSFSFSLREQENSSHQPQGLVKITSEYSASSITGPMKAIIITHHCVVGGQRRKRELGRSCQGGHDGGHWSKVDLGGRKGLRKAEKSFLPRGTEGGICILWGRDESKET